MADPLNVLLADLAEAFPRQAKDVTRATLQLYKRELEDLPHEALAHAVKALIRTSEWFPTVSAIRQAASERLLDLPSDAAALAQIEARLDWGRQRTGADEETPSTDGAPDVHPLVRDALELAGGFYAFRRSDNPAVVRGQFAKLYRELRAGKVRDIQIDSRLLER